MRQNLMQCADCGTVEELSTSPDTDETTDLCIVCSERTEFVAVN